MVKINTFLSSHLELISIAHKFLNPRFLFFLGTYS